MQLSCNSFPLRRLDLTRIAGWPTICMLCLGADMTCSNCASKNVHTGENKKMESNGGKAAAFASRIVHTVT